MANRVAPPPSPPRLGYVSGAEDKGEMHGYIGGKPPTREEGGNSQPRRQMPNFASPDPTLANSAFTQSQFTSSATIQSYANSNGSGTEAPPSREELRRINLQKYNESNRNGGRNNVCLPYPNFSGGRPANNRGSPQQQLSRVESLSDTSPPRDVQSTTTTSNSSGTPGSNTSSGSAAGSYIGFTFSDPGLMYKAFSGTSWVRMAQLIQPEGKRAKKVYASTMLMSTLPGDQYSLRLVDTSVTPVKTLWAEYDCTNTDNFKVFTMDAGNATAGGLLEIQAQNSAGQPILISTAIVEF